MTLAYIDAGVLIAAARGAEEEARQAFAVLDDPELTFASSIFVQLEVLPKPSYFGLAAEVEFYRVYFERVAAWAKADEALARAALEEASRSGLSAMDGLHVAAARAVGASELVTTERADKSIHRTSAVPTRSIRP